MLNLRPLAPISLSLATGGLVGAVALLGLAGLPAEASVPLTRADVEALRNRVEFLPRGRAARVARTSDFLAVGDALRTARSAQADLRFNDGSLARVGEQATFRFVPNTRNFRLTNGTVLLLIPPGQGRTNIQTPSAVTGIQGSAVVVRYVPERDLTVIMALTDNPTGPMAVTIDNCGLGATCGAPVEYALQAGQMALIQQNQVQVVEFDLPKFYETSPLVEGLELNNPEAESPLGPALEAVRQETLQALEQQSPFAEGMTLNPDFVSIGAGAAIASQSSWLLSPAGNGVAPLSTISGTLSPGSALVTTILPGPVVRPVGGQPSSVGGPGNIPGSGTSPNGGTVFPTTPDGAGAGTTGGVAVGPGDGGTGGGTGGIDIGVGTGGGGGTGGIDIGVGTGGGTGDIDIGVGTGGGGGGIDIGVGTGGNGGTGGIDIGVGTGGGTGGIDIGVGTGGGGGGTGGIDIGVGTGGGGTGGIDIGVGGGTGGTGGIDIGVGTGGGGTGSGPGNAEPPPLTGGDVPANPPAEPGPFFPPDK